MLGLMTSLNILGLMTRSYILGLFTRLYTLGLMTSSYIICLIPHRALLRLCYMPGNRHEIRSSANQDVSGVRASFSESQEVGIARVMAEH